MGENSFNVDERGSVERVPIKIPFTPCSTTSARACLTGTVTKVMFAL